jgi:hypothetical protein
LKPITRLSGAGKEHIMTARKNLALLATTLTLLAATCTVATAGASADSTNSSGHSGSSPAQQLNGTWTTTVQLTDVPPGAPSSFNALDTFLPGGGLLVSSSAPLPSSRSLAHGMWAKTGHREFSSTFVWFRFDAAGQYVGTQRVRRTMHLSKSRETFHATDVVEVIAPTGAVVATIHGTEVGTLLQDG